MQRTVEYKSQIYLSLAIYLELVYILLQKAVFNCFLNIFVSKTFYKHFVNCTWYSNLFYCSIWIGTSFISFKYLMNQQKPLNDLTNTVITYMKKAVSYKESK